MRYELADHEWGAIKPMLPNKPRGVPRVNDRRVLNGIFWVLRSGAPWRDLPEAFGPYTTCYNRFVRWRRAGVWGRIIDALATAHDAAVQMIDTSIVRVHQVTVASVSERLGSPTGSFYHRFASRDVLLGSLWLQAVLEFQAGISAALGAADGLGAALHTPAWVRKHPDQARLLLLYDRKDFLKGEWPPELRERVAEMTQRIEVGSRKWARVIFGKG